MIGETPRPGWPGVTVMSPELWERVSALLERAGDLEDSRREAYLQDIARREPSFFRQAWTYLKSLDEETWARPAVGRYLRRLHDPDLSGQRLGTWALYEKIGGGGMGVVYRAARADGQFEKDAAVKLIRQGVISPEVVQRFERERRILAQLEHPNIARLLDAGRTDDGLPYFVMEHVRGTPITEYCRQHGKALRQRLTIFCKVCRAVEYAHRNLIVHRDLKPENILVEDDGTPRLLDFGVAKLLETGGAGTGEAGMNTVFGPGPLTPNYASPEQHRGEPATTASDVFSLGVILYELLADQHPFLDDTRADYPQIRQAILEAVPDRPGAGGDLDEITLKALDKDPNTRYGSAQQLLDDINRYLSGQPVLARRATIVYRTGKFVRRYRVFSAALVILVVLTLVLWLQRREISRQRDDASQQRSAVLRLADAKRLRDLHEGTAELWPLHPSRRDAMLRWLTAARELVERLPGHLEALNTLRTQNVSDRGEATGSLTFDTLEVAWQDEVLTDLVEGIQQLDTELISDVQRRLDFVETLPRLSLAEPAARWSETLAAIADLERNPQYFGLEITPQLGLVPLEQDPESRLFEFAHLGSGSFPTRDTGTGQLLLDEGTAIVLVLLPGGSYRMGAQKDDPNAFNHDPQALDEEQPVREMRVAPFFLSKYETTQAQWARLTGGKWPSEHRPKADVPEGGERATVRNPVEQVSWENARRWLVRYNLNLPSEAEWEYACRAGRSSPWSTGRKATTLQGFANVADTHLKTHGGRPEWSYTPEIDDGFASHAPAGSFRPNPFGLFDLHGNVWEWTLDSYAPYAADATSDHRVARGGSWWYPALYARCTHRLYGPPTSKIADLGCRAARPIKTD